MDFIILASSRTGTKILNSYLHSQPDSHCFSELFNDKKNFLDKAVWAKGRKDESMGINIRSEMSKYIDEHTDQNKFKKENLELILNIVHKCKTKKFVGFKLLFWHIDDSKPNFNFIEYCIKNKTKIVLLNRDNVFLHYLSFKKALKSGVYNLRKDSPERKDDIKITLNPKHYLNWKEDQFLLYEYWENEFCKNNIPFLKTSYEKITGENRQEEKEKIYKFITCPESKVKPPKEIHIKQNIYTVKHQIENFKEVYEVLKDDPHFVAALELDKCKSPYGSS